MSTRRGKDTKGEFRLKLSGFPDFRATYRNIIFQQHFVIEDPILMSIFYGVILEFVLIKAVKGICNSAIEPNLT